MNVCSRITAIALTAAIVFATNATAAARRRVADTPSSLALVNGEPVTDKDLLAIFTDRHSGHANFLGGEGEARSFLSIVIDDRLLVQEAYALGLDRAEFVIKAVAELEDTKSRDLLVKQEIDQKSAPTPEEIQAAYEKLRYGYDVVQIAVATRTEAEEISDSLRAGVDAEELARSCSIAPSNLKGGNLKTSWGPYGAEWERAVFALEPGEISPVIPTPEGFEIVQLRNRVDLTPPPFADVQTYVEKIVGDRKLQQRKRDFSAELWSSYHAQLVLSSSAPAAVSKLIAEAPETVVATWDDGGSLAVKDVATIEELREWASYLPVRAERAVDERIHVTVNDALVIREAKTRNLQLTPDIQDAVAKYQDYLAEALLYRDHIFKDLAVPDQEVRKYFEEHKASFKEPEQRRVAHVMTTSLEEAQKAIKAIDGGTPFEEVAKKFSRDFSTAHTGGDLGWVTADKVPPLFKDVLSMSPGAHMKPVQSGKNWHVIKLIEVKPGRILEFSEAADRVREKVLDIKKQEARKFWVDKLRAASKIEIHDSAIKAFVAENQLKTLEGPAVQHSIPAGDLAGPTPKHP